MASLSELVKVEFREREREGERERESREIIYVNKNYHDYEITN